MKRTVLSILILLVCLSLFISCQEEPDEICSCGVQEFTTIRYTLTPSTGGDPIVLDYIDPDGAMGNAPTITWATLDTNQTYFGELEMYDETNGYVDSIGKEILQEAHDHQFFFLSTVIGLNVTYNDQDTTGKPVGMQSILTTGNRSTGTLYIVLRQEPIKSAKGVAEGDITNASGETNFEIGFPITVQ